MLKPFNKFAAIFAAGVIAGGLMGFLVAMRDDGGWFWQRHADLQERYQQLRIRLETVTAQHKDLKQQFESANRIASIEEAKRAANKLAEGHDKQAISGIDDDGIADGLVIAELHAKAAGSHRPDLIADY